MKVEVTTWVEAGTGSVADIVAALDNGSIPEDAKVKELKVYSQLTYGDPADAPVEQHTARILLTWTEDR